MENGTNNEHVFSIVPSIDEVAKEETRSVTKKTDFKFGLEDVPPWHMCIFLGFQHFLIFFGGILMVPFLLAPMLCLGRDDVATTSIMNSLLFVSGITTVLQVTLGVRLPIVQGPSFSYVLPIFGILLQPKWRCPEKDLSTNLLIIHNGTTHNITGDLEDDSWRARICEIQGAVLLASLFQLLAGATGLINVILRYMGPITITPVIVTMGLGLFQNLIGKCATQWGVAGLTIVLITVFTGYLTKVTVPCPTKLTCTGNQKPEVIKYPLLSMFAFILSVLLVWLLCYIMTITDVFGPTKEDMGYLARTDLWSSIIHNTPWFRMPYPCQYGMPTISVGGTLGMLAGVIASIIESVGDYHANARVCGAPPPPSHAVNRGILMEGIGGILSGLFGTSVGSTSYSQSTAALSLTKVCSRRVILTTGIIMILLSVFGKFGAIFVAIPEAIMGGSFICVIGMLTAVGLSNLQHVDLNSSRNLYILGLSIMLGVGIPFWTSKNRHMYATGISELDQIFAVLLTTGMFLSGLVAFVLDNTIPGTQEERGLLSMRHHPSRDESCDVDGSLQSYIIPGMTAGARRCRGTQYLPFCHNFSGACCNCKR